MKAYIQTDKLGNFYNVSAYVANDGFQTLGWETQKYVSADEITNPDPNKPTSVWCSEIVHFKTEWRCFIRYGAILDIRQYQGADGPN